MKLAEIMNCESIAFPLLGSGNNGYDKRLALEIATKCLEKTSVSTYLVIYGDRIAKIVEEEGYQYSTVPDEYKNYGVLSWEQKQKQPGFFEMIGAGLAKVGEFLAKKENLEMLLDAA